MTTERTVSGWAVPYRRYSTKGQARGSSEIRQEEGFASFLESSGLPAAPEPYRYWDKGKSGYKGHHKDKDGEFGRLLADCDRQAFPAGSVVWCEDMDRFGRQTLDIVLPDWMRILRSGYRIHVSSLGQTYTSDTPQMELIGVIMKAILAHDESQKKAGRLKKSWHTRRESGRPTTTVCPHWLTWDEAAEAFVFNERAEAMRKAVRMSTDGMGAYTILRQLGLTNDRSWQGLAGVLRDKDRHLIGCYRHRTREGGKKVDAGDLIPDYYPALIGEDDWLRLQNAIDGRTTAPGGERGEFCTCLFTGRITYPDGTPMVVGSLSRNAERILKPANGKRREGADYPTVKYALVEERVLRCLAETIAPDDLRPSSVCDAEDELSKVEAQLIANRMEQDEIQELVRAGKVRASLAVMTSASLQERREELTARREELKRQRAAAGADAVSEAKDLIAALAGLEGGELTAARFKLSALIRSVVKSVVVTVLANQGWRKPNECAIAITLKSGRELTYSTGRWGRVGVRVEVWDV